MPQYVIERPITGPSYLEVCNRCRCPLESDGRVLGRCVRISDGKRTHWETLCDGCLSAVKGGTGMISTQDCPHMCPEHVDSEPACQLCRTIFLLWAAARRGDEGSRKLLDREPLYRIQLAEAIISTPGQSTLLVFEHPLTEPNKEWLRRRFGSASVYITAQSAALSETAARQYRKQYPWRDGDRPLDRLVTDMHGGKA